jgi:hypothetical protein
VSGREQSKLAISSICACVILSIVTAVAHAEDGNMAALKRAEELLKVMNLEKVTMDGVNAAFDLQVQNNPTLGPYREVMRVWAGRYLSWDAIAPKIAALYAQTFTERELQELTAFYRTPTGQKSLKEMVNLYQKSAAIGQEIGQQHQKELQEMMRARATQLEQASKKSQ